MQHRVFQDLYPRADADRAVGVADDFHAGTDERVFADEHVAGDCVDGTGPPGVDGTGAATPVSAGGAPAAGPRSADGYQARRFRAPRRTSLLGTRSAVTDAGVVTARNLRHFIRQPQLLIFSTIQPVMFVLLFA